jgi:integrase
VPAHVVSRMLGHASVAITLSIYAHVTPRLLDAATAAMDARYGPAS